MPPQFKDKSFKSAGRGEVNLDESDDAEKDEETKNRIQVNLGKLEIEAALSKAKVAEMQVNMTLIAARAKKEGIEADLEPLRVEIEAFTARHNAIMGEIKAAKEKASAKGTST